MYVVLSVLTSRNSYTVKLAKYDSPAQIQRSADSTHPNVENHCRPRDAFKDDDIENSQVSSDTLQERDVVHVVGDIIHVRRLSCAIRTNPH